MASRKTTKKRSSTTPVKKKAVAKPPAKTKKSISKLTTSLKSKTKDELIEENAKLLRKVARLEKKAATTSEKTDTKNAEKELRKSELMNRSLLEGSPICTKIIDLNFNLQYMSSAGVNTLKIPDITAFYGRTYPSVSYPESIRTPFVRELKRAITTGKATTVECPLLDIDGNEVWYITTFVPVFDDGEIKYIIGSSVDITERRKVEEALKLNEEFLRKAQEIGHVGSWHLDIEKNILSWSDEEYRIFGHTPQSFGATYEAFLEAVHPDDREMVNTTYTEAIENNTSYECVHKVLRPNGEIRTVLERSEDIIDEKGKTIHSYGMTLDITEQVIKEKHRDSILSTSLDGFWVVDIKGKFLEVNDAYCEMIGYSKTELFTMSITDIEAIENPEETKSRIDRIIKEGSDRFESKHRRKSGDLINVEISTIFNPDYKTFNVFIRDVTEQKKAEKALRESELLNRSLLEGSPVCTKIIDLDSKLQYMSSAGVNDLKVPNIKPYYGQTYPPEFYSESMRAPLVGGVKGAMAGKTTTVECPVHDLEGDVVWYFSTFVPVFDDDGRVKFIIGTSVNITERKEAEKELLKKSEHMEKLLNALPCFAVILKGNREIVALNDFAKNIGAVKGKRCFETMAPFNSPCKWCKADAMLKDGEFKNSQFWGLDSYWDSYWIPLEDDLYLHFAFDITESRKVEEKVSNSLKEKEVLLKEVHHRVKNNMAVISSLLALQSGYIDDKKYQDMFSESQSRIRSMALVHEKLYLSDDFAHIDVKDYVTSLAKDIRSSFHADDIDVKLNINIEEINLDIDNLVPCGLLMNEILTNSFKHAFDGHDNPEISITMKKVEDGNVSLSISDNGSGLPDGYDISKPTGLGHKLIKPLIKQIDGKMDVNVSNGTEFRIVFPEKLNIARAD